MRSSIRPLKKIKNIRMKSKSIFLSIFTLMLAVFSGVDASAQAMLKGNPSMENFIGSPGMWVITLGVIFMVIFILFIRRKTKMIPEPVRKKLED